MEEAVLDIKAPDGHPVSNEFLFHNEPAGVAILFPGRSYGTDQAAGSTRTSFLSASHTGLKS